MRTRRGARVVVAAAALLVLTAAASGCSDSGRDRTTLDLTATGGASPDAGTGSVEEWIAVFRTEADPHDMTDETAEVLTIVGGAIIVSPAACFEGLPADIPLESYLLGVVAPTKQALDDLVARVDRTVIFEGQVRTMCLD